MGGLERLSDLRRNFQRFIDREDAFRNELDPGDNFITIQYNNGYDTRVDGCVFAPFVRAVNPATGLRESVEVRGVFEDGRPVDLSACGMSTSRRGSFAPMSMTFSSIPRLKFALARMSSSIEFMLTSLNTLTSCLDPILCALSWA